MAESNIISAITASTPYSGRPIGVVNETALVALAMLEAAALDTAALVVALVVAALDTIALVVVALDTTLVSTLHHTP